MLHAIYLPVESRINMVAKTRTHPDIQKFLDVAYGGVSTEADIYY